MYNDRFFHRFVHLFPAIIFDRLSIFEHVAVSKIVKKCNRIIFRGKRQDFPFKYRVDYILVRVLNHSRMAFDKPRNLLPDGKITVFFQINQQNAAVDIGTVQVHIEVFQVTGAEAVVHPRYNILSHIHMPKRFQRTVDDGIAVKIKKPAYLLVKQLGNKQPDERDLWPPVRNKGFRNLDVIHL